MPTSKDLCLAEKPYPELQVTIISLEINSGSKVQIAAPLQNLVPIPGNHYPYLHGLPPAHPVRSDDNFEINLLIGADFYWNIVQDRIVCGNGPTAVESKIGYLLLGPLSHPIML